MVRDIQKALDQYDRLYDNRTGAGDFFTTDIKQIYDMHTGGIPCCERSYDFIWTALKAGYAIGYRTAVRHTREKTKTEIVSK